MIASATRYLLIQEQNHICFQKIFYELTHSGRLLCGLEVSVVDCLGLFDKTQKFPQTIGKSVSVTLPYWFCFFKQWALVIYILVYIIHNFAQTFYTEICMFVLD